MSLDDPIPKDRRMGPTHFWEAFWKYIYGERRQDRQGCTGNCNQGRRPCDCRKPMKEQA